jgi:hypothetical protein
MNSTDGSPRKPSTMPCGSELNGPVRRQSFLAPRANLCYLSAG